MSALLARLDSLAWFANFEFFDFEDVLSMRARLSQGPGLYDVIQGKLVLRCIEMLHDSLSVCIWLQDYLSVNVGKELFVILPFL